MGEDEAARVIQAGFKNALKRRNTGSSIVTVVPNGDSNTTTAGAGEFETSDNFNECAFAPAEVYISKTVEIPEIPN